MTVADTGAASFFAHEGFPDFNPVDEAPSGHAAVTAAAAFHAVGHVVRREVVGAAVLREFGKHVRLKPHRTHFDASAATHAWGGVAQG